MYDKGNNNHAPEKKMGFYLLDFFLNSSSEL